MRDHRDLHAWQEAMRLVEMTYKVTASFPRREIFGLTAQVQRSAVSIPSNIAEGAARNSSKEFVHFLGVASGSRAELHTQLDLACRLNLIQRNAEIFSQLERVAQLLTALRKAMRLKIEPVET